MNGGLRKSDARQDASPVVRGHWPCPCGSGAVLRRCHRATVLNLREQRRPQKLLGLSAARGLKIVQASTNLQVAELRRLAVIVKRIDKNLKAA
jgi:hypothetical protein